MFQRLLVLADYCEHCGEETEILFDNRFHDADEPFMVCAECFGVSRFRDGEELDFDEITM